MNPSMRTVLLTGATGLIGSHTAAGLVRNGFRVRALVRDGSKLDAVLEPFAVDRSAIETLCGDVTDPASVRDAAKGCDSGIHCAGRFSHDLTDAAALREINVLGTETVLRAAIRERLDPVIHVSSMLALLPPRGPVMNADDPVGTTRAMYSKTKVDADRIARALQAEGAPVAIVYPGSVHGPNDPTLGSGPELFARYLRTGRVLVTRGGLAYTDVRDLAELLVEMLQPGQGPSRIMAPSVFVEHDRFHKLLCELTGRTLKADFVPASILWLLGHLGDLRQRITGRPAQLTAEAALVLTRSVPFEDAEGRKRLGTPALDAERSFRDLLRWMFDAGVLGAEQVGRIADDGRIDPPD